MAKSLWLLFLGLSLFAGLLLGTRLFFREITPTLATITINNQPLRVEIAATPDRITQGLSGRNFLPPDQGLLFVFRKPDFRRFWMKDMKFNLDFVFLNDGQVVALSENIAYPQNDNPPIVVDSLAKCDRVLEINAGAINRLGLKVGDRIQF